MSTPIDHDYTDSIVCPHCGAEHEDCGDWPWDSAEQCRTDCETCGKDFTVTRDFSISYSTKKEPA
jgi:transposase-like protein